MACPECGGNGGGAPGPGGLGQPPPALLVAGVRAVLQQEGYRPWLWPQGGPAVRLPGGATGYQGELGRGPQAGGGAQHGSLPQSEGAWPQAGVRVGGGRGGAELEQSHTALTLDHTGTSSHWH